MGTIDKSREKWVTCKTCKIRPACIKCIGQPQTGQYRSQVRCGGCLEYRQLPLNTAIGFKLIYTAKHFPGRRFLRQQLLDCHSLVRGCRSQLRNQCHCGGGHRRHQPGRRQTYFKLYSKSHDEGTLKQYYDECQLFDSQLRGLDEKMQNDRG